MNDRTEHDLAKRLSDFLPNTVYNNPDLDLEKLVGAWTKWNAQGNQLADREKELRQLHKFQGSYTPAEMPGSEFVFEEDLLA